MATTRNLYVDQGADFSLPFTVSDANGNPLDLRTYQLHSMMKRSYESIISHQLEVSSPNPESGEIELSIPAETSLGVRAGRYVYDVLIVDADNISTRVLEGIVTISPAVTKVMDIVL